MLFYCHVSGNHCCTFLQPLYNWGVGAEKQTVLYILSRTNMFSIKLAYVCLWKFWFYFYMHCFLFLFILLISWRTISRTSFLQNAYFWLFSWWSQTGLWKGQTAEWLSNCCISSLSLCFLDQNNWFVQALYELLNKLISQKTETGCRLRTFSL